MTKYKGSNPSTAARKTRQANLNDAELSDLFNLSSDPDRKGSLGLAIRTVIERHKEQITENAALKQILKQLTEPVTRESLIDGLNFISPILKNKLK